MGNSRRFHAGNTGSNPVRSTTCKTQESGEYHTPLVATKLPSRRGTTLLETVGPALIIAVLAVVVLISSCAPRATAAPRSKILQPDWFPALATWYGPGLYGNGLACGGRLTTRTQGVAHRTLPCGTKVTFKLKGRIVRVRVIDRGPYSAATWDLTGATAQTLCGCRRPYTTRLHWHTGWSKP